jgi:hypothetical protein
MGRLVSEYPAEPRKSNTLMAIMSWPYGVLRLTLSRKTSTTMAKEPRRDRMAEVRGTQTRALRFACVSAPA